MQKIRPDAHSVAFSSNSPPGERMSRRHALQRFGRMAAGAAISTAAPACARPVQASDEDDDAFVQRQVAEASPRIPRRDKPYRLTRSVRIPAGRTVAIDPGSHFVWAGPPGTGEALVGVFEADGDDTGVVVAGGEALVECATPHPFVYAALMRGFRGFAVANLRASECGHVHVGPSTSDYAKIRLDGAAANAPREVQIQGGGASYAKLQPFGHGACYLGYVANCQVRGSQYHNVPNGVQWWGGNADPVRPPAQGGSADARKCRNLLIENVTVEHCSGAGIWGSMGTDIVVRRCSVANIGDVGFDAEGSNRVTFERCTGRNARNGCFTTFFLCNGVRFVDCTGIVDDKAMPLVRVYNESQTNWDNIGLEVVGGTFECRDAAGAGTIDTAMGPVGTLAITGATLKNVRIDVAHSNMHRTTIAHNTIYLPHPLGSFAAIRAGSSKSLQKAPTVIPGSVVVEDNVIRYAATVGTGDAAVGIALVEDDFNSAAVDTVRRNQLSGPFRIGVAVTNASANAGIVPAFVMVGNRFTGLAPAARLLTVAQAGTPARRPTVRWDHTQTLDGRAVALARALR